MSKPHQKGKSALRVVTCGLPDSPKMTLIVDDKRMLCYQRWQDGRWEPIYAQDERPYRKNLEVAEAINRL